MSQMKLETSTVINCPVKEVFAVVSNHENYPKWDSSVIEVKKTSSGPIGLGTTWRSVSKRLGKRTESEWEIIEYELHRKITRQRKQGIRERVQLTFESVGSGTRFAEIIEAEPGGFFKLVVPVLLPLVKREHEATLANLKERMEAQAL
jgi:uncharacterized membrane protein